MTAYTIPSLCGGLALALMTVLDPPLASADEYGDHLARADQLAHANNYRGALAELKAAYAIEQAPMLLLSMARLHAQLGDGREALDAYRRFKVAVPSAEPELQKEADAAVANLGAIYEPRPAADGATTLARLETLLLGNNARTETDRLRRRNTGLLAGGSVLFSLGYAAAFFTGSLTWGLGGCDSYRYGSTSYLPYGKSTNQQCAAANALLLLPIAGPVVSSLVWSSNLAWSIPWTFVGGAAQLGGLAMMIIGGKSNSALTRGPLASVRLLPYSTGAQAGLTVAGRF